MRKQVELLKDHARLGPHGVDVRSGVHDVVSVHDDGARGRRFQPVDAAQHGGFARAGRPDDTDHFSGPDFQVDTFQDFQIPECFVQLLDVNHFLVLLCRRSSRMCRALAMLMVMGILKLFCQFNYMVNLQTWIEPTINYHDVQSNFSEFIFATPCTKRDYVLSKYFPAFITAILSLFVNVIFSSFSGMSLQDIILIGTIGFSLPLLSVIFLIPAILKFGVEKGKFLMVFFYFIIFALINKARKIIELVNELSVRFQFLTIYHMGSCSILSSTKGNSPSEL